MRNAGLEEAQARVKTAGRNSNNLRYADDTTLMAESEEELKSLLMKVKKESEKVGFEVVKQEMTGVNVDILGISELRWTGMGEFNSDDHYIYYCGQESLRRNGLAIIVNKRVQNTVLGCSLKNDRMISVSEANRSISR